MIASFTKVCGIQTIDEALGAVNAGANTVGLLLGLTHLAEDKITPDTARSITASLPSGIRSVMVTHLLDEAEIADMAEFTGVGAIQVHDDLSVEGMVRLRTLAPDVTLIKAVHVMGDDAVDTAKSYAGVADMLLLDSRTKDRLGGTGLTHDWNISRTIVMTVSKPVILAGGLRPENVAAAIEKVCPAGIDANSGLEHADGRKDFAKIALFAAAGRACIYPPRL